MSEVETKKLYNVRVRPSLWNQVEAIAKTKRVPTAEAVRDALAEYVHRNRKLLAQVDDGQVEADGERTEGVD